MRAERDAYAARGCLQVSRDVIEVFELDVRVADGANQIGYRRARIPLIIGRRTWQRTCFMSFHRTNKMM